MIKEIRDYDFLDLEAYRVQTEEKEILDFFIESPLLKTSDLLDDAHSLRFNDGKWEAVSHFMGFPRSIQPRVALLYNPNSELPPILAFES